MVIKVWRKALTIKDNIRCPCDADSDDLLKGFLNEKCIFYSVFGAFLLSTYMVFSLSSSIRDVGGQVSRKV